MCRFYYNSLHRLSKQQTLPSNDRSQNNSGNKGNIVSLILRILWWGTRMSKFPFFFLIYQLNPKNNMQLYSLVIASSFLLSFIFLYSMNKRSI